MIQGLLYFRQVCANKFENLEVDKFMHTYQSQNMENRKFEQTNNE